MSEKVAPSSRMVDRVVYLPRTCCPLHGSPNSLQKIATVYDPATRLTFDVRKCETCGVALTDPYPSEETTQYLYLDRSSIKTFDSMKGSFIDSLKDWFARCDVRGMVRRLGRKPVSLLDFGTGIGRFAIAASQCFRECFVTAVDFDAEPPAGLLPRLDERFRYQALEAFQKSQDLYDVIILRHVLEHMHYPVEFLHGLAGRLTPGGVMYIEVPNLNSAFIHFFGENTNQYSVPTHLFFYTKDVLHSVVQKAGMQVLSAKQKGMPLVGTIMAERLGQERTLAHQVIGMLLHPVQMAVELFYGKPHLAFVCRAGANPAASSPNG